VKPVACQSKKAINYERFAKKDVRPEALFIGIMQETPHTIRLGE